MPRFRGLPGALRPIMEWWKCARSGTCRLTGPFRGKQSMNACTGDEARNTAEAVARRSYGKLVAFVAARSRDLAAAEDALSEAFASALQSWPQNGCPANPEAWLLTVARRKLIDMVRREHGSE